MPVPLDVPLPMLPCTTTPCSVTVAPLAMWMPAPVLLLPPWTLMPDSVTVPLRTSKTRFCRLPLMRVRPLPLPTISTEPLMSKSPPRLLSSPIEAMSWLIVPLAPGANSIRSAPGLALAWLMAQRSVPGLAEAPAKSSLLVTV